MLTEVADLEPRTFNEQKMIIRKIKYQLTTAPAIFVSICYALVLRVWAKKLYL
jgi:hypothetical protein